ncbi:MAG: TraB/GumN family protein [Flavobacteriales bacterium]
MRHLLVSIALASLSAHGQGSGKSLLWRITSPSIDRASYLYGTVHSKDDRAFQFGDSVLPALDRCAVVAGELDLSTAGMELGMALLTTMRMEAGKKLEDLYRPKEWKRIDAAIQENMGFMAPMAMSMKPFFVVALLTENLMAGDRPQVLDEHLQYRAKANGQRVLGIETVKEQMAAVDAVPIPVQAKMLLDHVEHDGYAGDLDAMLDAYADQDLEALMAITERTEGMPDELEHSLLTERNTRMVHRMDSLIREGEPVFFLIGAAHLPRTDGLIAGLRTAGYTVEPVVSRWNGVTDPAEER